MPSTPLILNTLAGGMLVLSFLILGRMRLVSMLRLFSGQSLLLAAYAFVAAAAFHEPYLIGTAVLVLVLKVFYIPRLLLKTAKSSRVMHRLHAYLRPSMQLALAAVMILFGFIFAQSFMAVSPENLLIASVSVSMVLLGMLMLVVRKGMYSQIIGFLMMENGIFIFGLALTGGMPALVEVGIFSDVLIGSIVMATLAYRVQKEFGTVVTDRLSELVD